jgi:hypothetical protein
LGDNTDIGIKPKKEGAMSEYDQEDVENDEDVEDLPEDIEDNKEIDEALLEKVEVLKEGGAYWAEDLLKIENERLQEKEIEASEKYVEKVRAAKEKFEAEGKDFKYFWAENPHLVTGWTKISSRIARESVGVSGDDLGDFSEDMRLLAAYDLDALDAKERNKTLLMLVDPEVGKELAEKVIEEEEVSEEGAESLRRLARLRELGSN